MNDPIPQTAASAERRLTRSLTASDCLFAGVVVLIVGLWTYTRLIAPATVDPQAQQPAMPVKVSLQVERQLYLEPGGLYTAADIAANDRMTASEKFVGFRVTHDFNPQPGDLLCPITRTKANPDCSWIVGGHRYSFCCPPCIDEFVEMAKQWPDRIERPAYYVK